MTATQTTETPTDTTTSDIDFYTPPALGEHHQPGEILRLRPAPTPGLPGAGSAWQVLYVSRNTCSVSPVPVSGIVITPAGPVDELAPILLYYPAFHGLGGDCAPSQRLAAGDEPDTAQISAALARGWRVAVVDGEGLGVRGQGPHTFLAGRAAGQVMLDLGRAAARIPAMHAAHAPVVAWGYADGARAAMWAGELQPRYAPELNLRGLAAGAVITDPKQFLRKADQGSWPALGLAGLVGLSHAYGHIPLRHVFNLEVRNALLPAIEEASVDMLCARYQHRLVTWCDRTVWKDPMWQHVFEHEHTDADLVPAVPVHLYHGITDAIVPIAFGRKLFRRYRAGGVRVSWRQYEADHSRTRTQAIEDVLDRLINTLTTGPSGSPATTRTARP
ncbi:lipase family protein [Nocardia miyunensis]|uniref:lipase family protein n=1 Tax=Nocardia miyunensis TaxID=282684 RepID=UPI00082C6A37|nr:lipase family protein [Nocardia miyunensis]